ncbi:MAG: TIGR00725 family protein [Candidatus Bathyarchaeia archaeon]
MVHQILVIGYSEDHCTKRAYEMSREVGREIARQKAVLVTGGLGGVMEAASRGARENGGLAIGIIPQEDKIHANEYCNVVVCTGMGYMRDFITAYTGDAVIIIGGGAGTEIEALVAYFKQKPIVALVGSGGVADKLAGTHLDDRQLIRVMAEKEPQKAVKAVLSILERPTTGPTIPRRAENLR